MSEKARNLVAIIISAILVVSYSPGQKHNYSVSNLDISLSGPLFSGPNTGQAEIVLDLEEALGENYSESMSVDEAYLKSATVVSNDGLGFSNINAFVLSFASYNEAVLMQEAAVKNPIDQGSESIILDISEDAELGEIMDERTVIVVLDADLLEDYWDGDRNFKLNLELELTIK